jgi:flavin-binding protein dodecin
MAGHVVESPENPRRFRSQVGDSRFRDPVRLASPLELERRQIAERAVRAGKEESMSEVARVTEISARSSESFEDAIRTGIARATKTLRGVKSGWVKEQEVVVGEGGNIVEYQVNMLVTFVLED